MQHLFGLTILVTRPEPQGTELCRLISEQGGHAICFPTIAFAPAPNLHIFQQAVALLGEQDWLIFISPQAVYASVAPIRKVWPEFSGQTQFAAVGAGTAKALHEAGYNVIVKPFSEWSSQGLLDMPEFKAVTGKKIAIVRGVGGRELLDKVLAERGAHILPVIAYARVVPEVDIHPCLNLLEKRIIDILVCTSYEGVQNLKIMLGEAGWPYIKDLPLVVMSERIKMLAHNLGFQTIWVTHNASQTAILEACRKKEPQ
jgi:uroporphyrinogen-III synthase